MKSSTSKNRLNLGEDSKCDEISNSRFSFQLDSCGTHRGNVFKPLNSSMDKAIDGQYDGDSGLSVDCPCDSGEIDSRCLDDCTTTINDNSSTSKHDNSRCCTDQSDLTTGDSGLGIDFQRRFSEIDISGDKQTVLIVEKTRLTSRPLDNVSVNLRNAEKISKLCSRIINQISPQHRMQLVEDAFAPDKDGDTKLHLAAIHARLDIIFTLIYLVPHPAFLDLQNNLGQTTMHLAVLTGQPRVVRRLVLAGASPVVRDRHGNTPLHLACERGELDCVKELTRPVTSIELQYLQLMNSAVYECLPKIAIPPNLEIYNYEGKTCVHIATLNQHTDILLWLKQFGANIDAQESKGGRTPLTFAVEARNSNLVEFLVEECHANVDVKNYAGLSAFEIAYGMDEKIASQLESLGAFPTYPCFSDSDSDLESMDTSDVELNFYDYEIELPLTVK